MPIKQKVRDLLNLLHLDLTKNLEYDRLTKLIMRRMLSSSSSCIDVGCHRGEMLEAMLRYAPTGKHFAFEPIPSFYNDLKSRYNGQVTILPYALSDRNGESSFQYIRNAPAYSGIKRRQYAVDNPLIEEIAVELRTLDAVIPSDLPIDLIKIDVEGAEFGVLLGARKVLKTFKPLVIFESGLGASDYYGTNPNELFSYLTSEIGLKISTLKAFIGKGQPLSRNGFLSCYDKTTEFYYIAHP